MTQTAESLSLELRIRLSQAKEDAGEIKAAIWLRIQHRIEGRRRLFRNILFMDKKMKVGSTTHVSVTYDDGTTIEYPSKASIENFTAKWYDAIIHQTEGGVNSHIIPLWNNWISM